MEVPGSIPGVRKSLFWACWEGVFLDFYTCWTLLGDTFERGWGNFLVGSGSLFRHFWDVLGSVWEWSEDIFRQMLEGIFLDFYICWTLLGDTFQRGWGHFLVGSGSLFRHFWDVLGSAWEWSGDIFR